MGTVLQESALIAESAIGQGANQKERELAEFIELVAQLKPEVIVEIGVDAGGTLYAWKQLADTVIGIDDRPGGPEPIYCISGKPRDEHGAEMIIGDSHDLATVKTLTDMLDGRSIDCLFIDGDHTYFGVRSDYQLYAPLVRSGGLIGFHDIAAWRSDHIEVPQFWAEVKDESSIELIDLSDPKFAYGIGFGIGVLCVP